MLTKTYGEVLGAFDVEVPAHLVADAEVPIIGADEPQRQGDVWVDPSMRRPADIGELVPPEGVAVVRGEAGGNTHLLVAFGDVWWKAATARADALAYGTFTVADGAEAYLVHPEHGAHRFGPGCYPVSGQREQADEIRRVAD